MAILTEVFPVAANDFDSAGEASAQIKRLLKKLGVDGGVVRRISIASYEAEINLVIHSLGGQMELQVDGEYHRFCCACRRKTSRNRWFSRRA